MSEKNKFDPMYEIPTMEELDRQWRESQKEKQSQSNHSEGSKRAGRNSNVQSSKNEKTKRKSRKPAKKKKQKRFKKLRMFFKILFLMILLGTLGVIVFFYFRYGDDLLKWKNESKRIVSESNKGTFKSSEASTIYTSNKKPIAKLKGDKDSCYIDFSDIPKAAIDCMVVTEDRDFYEHGGVNLLSTGKAAVLYIKGKITGDNSITRGGSTITQQLVKNVFLTNAQTEERKMREMFIATELEKKYTKDEIMEFYLNVICFANNHFGIEAASKAYFSKSVKELDLAEIAFLCAIPNRPTDYDPLQHFDNTNKRKVRILDQLLAAGKITAAEYSDAKYKKIILNPAQTLKTQDYMTTYAVSCATKALMKHRGFEFRYKFKNSKERKAYDKEYKESYDECHNLLYTGGYNIYTTLSQSKQSKLQKAVNTTLAGFKSKTKEGTYKMQGAATCIDNKTGYVVAIVGGRKQKNTVGYTLNRGFQSYRQPGSCFKPLVVYTPQLERDYTPSSIVDDSPFKGGPKNSSGTYSGKITLRYAVEQSKNVIAWKLFEELSPKVGLSYVTNMNFSQIVSSDYYPAASLGGLTNGVSTVEMASGYATIENNGVYREPTCVKKITDSKGNVLINNNKAREQKQVYEESAAKSMTDILTGVLIRGTAHGKQLSNDMACAGKTGTTSDKKDGWFCGYTPYYTTTVWVGYDNPTSISDLYGSTYPLSIWYNYMEDIHSDLEPEQFEGLEEKDSEQTNKYEENDKKPTEEPTMDPDAKEVDSDDDSDEEKTKDDKATKKPVETKAPTVTKAPEVTKAPVEPSDETDEEDIPDDTEEETEDIPEDGE